MPLIRILFVLLLTTQFAYSFDGISYVSKEIDAICEDYIESTKADLSEALKTNSEPLKPADTHIISGKYLKMKFKLKFLGEIRDLSKEHLEDMKVFEKSFPQILPKPSEISKKEVLMLSKSGKKHWLPIQDVLIEPLKTEVAKNQEIYVYVVALQHVVTPSYKCRGGYLIGEFQAITKELLQQDEIKELYSQGQALLNDSKLDKAEVIFKKILKLNPKHDDALSNICLVEQGRHQYDKALECYDKVIKMDPEAYEAFYSKGNIFNQQKKPNEAIKELDKAIELFSKQKLPANALANAYYLRAASKASINSKDAVADLEKAHELNPKLVSEEKLAEFRKRFDK